MKKAHKSDRMYCLHAASSGVPGTRIRWLRTTLSLGGYAEKM